VTELSFFHYIIADSISACVILGTTDLGSEMVPLHVMQLYILHRRFDISRVHAIDRPFIEYQETRDDE
jgi:hypothetical protein